jgi:hypothetical protein
VDFGLNQQEKIAALTGLRTSMKREIYSILLRVGIDPDTFDSSDLSGFPELMTGEKERVTTLIGGLALIESKLSELE